MNEKPDLYWLYEEITGTAMFFNHKISQNDFIQEIIIIIFRNYLHLKNKCHYCCKNL